MRHAPELHALIRQGILSKDNLTVCRGWIEQSVKSVRQFIEAPCVSEIRAAYHHDPTRVIHQVDLDASLVLDQTTMAELQTTLSANQWTALYAEWAYWVECAFRQSF